MTDPRAFLHGEELLALQDDVDINDEDRGAFNLYAQSRNEDARRSVPLICVAYFFQKLLSWGLTV